jgi:DNA polymerase-1
MGNTLVYGMTEFGLSKDPKMGMTVEQAAKFIEEYMATFTGVKAYANEMIAFARKHGYVETMLNHRRPIPEINHPNKWIRAKGENKAMNTPIQGSAADLIRLAMVNIRREQPAWFKGVMQIHDELQAEVPVEYGVEGCDFMQGVMERPVDGFSEIMPIVSEPAIGATWDTALELKRKPDGTPYVKPKQVKKEATDVTYDMIAPYEHYYKLAGIEIAG